MQGTHWQSDNQAFWDILSEVVRDGPAWDYISGFETTKPGQGSKGDGRGAYFALVAQAFQQTNVRAIKQEARTAAHS